ncbi:MAG: sensor histidine kinase, partial [Anaerolineae bacterium]|nr:sensor histidine kinase [Anaerolineae bacterium]
RETSLASQEARELLDYLASAASVALDNARLLRETEEQKEQLRSFVEESITKEELTSRQIALDLHDGLVQQIIASYQHLQAAQALRNRDPEGERKEIRRGIEILRSAIYEARRLISQLRPAGLDDFGLAHALRLYTAQIAAEENWQLTLDIAPDWPSLPDSYEASLFRIVQEAINNTRKYAAARKVRVRLEVVQDALWVSVQDWGRGFDPNKVQPVLECGSQIGLVGIRERARLLGGECLIESAPGEGTRIVVRVPVPKSQGGNGETP